MTKRQIESKFPITVKVTASIIKKAKLDDPEKCIGALTLKSVIKGWDIGTRWVSWGAKSGNLFPAVPVTPSNLEKWKKRVVTIYASTNMMLIDKPQTVTLTIES